MRQSLKRVKWRWFALILTSLFICGSYWTYDNPAELQTQIMKQFNVSVMRYSYLYAVYSLPNIVLPIFGGSFIHRFGKGTSLLVTTFIVFFGQFMCSIGGYTDSFSTLLIGRGIHGAGCETMFVVR